MGLPLQTLTAAATQPSHTPLTIAQMGLHLGRTLFCLPPLDEHVSVERAAGHELQPTRLLCRAFPEPPALWNAIALPLQTASSYEMNTRVRSFTTGYQGGGSSKGTGFRLYFHAETEVLSPTS